MKTTIFASLISVILLTSCGSSTPVEVPKTPEQLKAELLSQEKIEPLTYLTVDGTMRADEVKTRDEGLFHSAEYSPDGNTIHGTIKNTATMAKFKDIVLTVTYYSQTETAIESKDFTIYEFYSPNSTTPFELKVHPPESMAKFGIEIITATATD
jgi:hypothetical protein